MNVSVQRQEHEWIESIASPRQSQPPASPGPAPRLMPLQGAPAQPVPSFPGESFSAPISLASPSLPSSRGTRHMAPLPGEAYSAPLSMLPPGLPGGSAQQALTKLDVGPVSSPRPAAMLSPSPSLREAEPSAPSERPRHAVPSLSGLHTLPPGPTAPVAAPE